MADPYAPPGSAPARPPVHGTPPAPQRPPAAQRPPVAPDPGAALRTAQLVGRFTLLVAAGVVASQLDLPWRTGALVFLLGALVVGVMAMVWAVRAGARPGALVAIGLGLAATALIVLIQVATLALWTQESRLQRCQQDALTQRALQACAADESKALQGLLRSSG